MSPRSPRARLADPPPPFGRLGVDGRLPYLERSTHEHVRQYRLGAVPSRLRRPLRRRPPRRARASATSSDPAPAGSGAATPAASSAPTAAAPAASAAPARRPQTVDAKAVLEGLAAKNPQKLDWQHSIVDMMKLLDLDSSLASRKQLAQELHYTGDMEDSAAMNVWLQAR